MQGDTTAVLLGLSGERRVMTEQHANQGRVTGRLPSGERPNRPAEPANGVPANGSGQPSPSWATQPVPHAPAPPWPTGAGQGWAPPAAPVPASSPWPPPSPDFGPARPEYRPVHSGVPRPTPSPMPFVDPPIHPVPMPIVEPPARPVPMPPVRRPEPPVPPGPVPAEPPPPLPHPPPQPIPPQPTPPPDPSPPQPTPPPEPRPPEPNPSPDNAARGQHIAGGQAAPGHGHFAGSGRYTPTTPLAGVPGGLRKRLSAVTRGIASPTSRAATEQEEAILSAVRAPIREPRIIAFLGLKGGVGKTTTAALTGVTLATQRGDSCAVLDVNPDRGTLVSRLSTRPAPAMADLRRYVTEQGHADPAGALLRLPTGLHLLDSTRSPLLADMPGPDDVRGALAVLPRRFAFTLVDCGTSVTDPVVRALLPMLTDLVIVTTPSFDAARSTDTLFDVLSHGGYANLTGRALTVVSEVRSGRRDRGLVDEMVTHFARRGGSAVSVPFDPALTRGGVVDVQALAPQTRERMLRIAARLVSRSGI